MVLAQEDRHEPGRARGTLLHILPALVLMGLLALFALANTRRTRVDLVFSELRAPLIVVLLATAVVGALIASLLRTWWIHRD